LKEAIRDKDIVEVADALTDLLYVVYGAGHAFGIDLDKCFNEVHRSNMSKLGLDGKPIYREDGKVLKGQNYFDPDLITIVQGDNNGKETNE
jgi:predicted HAD superfamily Cof-like phosphohydrolase